MESNKDVDVVLLSDDNKNENSLEKNDNNNNLDNNGTKSKKSNSCFRNSLIAYKGSFYALISAFFMGSSNVLVKKANIFSGSEQAMVRYLMQIIVMGSIILVKKSNLLGPKETRTILLLRGLFGMVGLVSLHFAVKLINPSDAVALFHLNMALICILAKFFLKEKLSIAHLVAILFSIMGVFLISQPSFLFPNKLQINENLNSTISNDSSSLCSFYLSNSTSRNFVDDVNSMSNQSNKIQFENLNTTRENCLNLKIENSNSNSFNNNKKILGVSLGVLGALVSSVVSILLKKLAQKNVHYSVAIIYAAYCGLPFCIAISTTMILTGYEKKDPKILDDVPSLLYQIIFSLLSAATGLLSQAFWNLSLKYENASKVSLFRSTDLVFAYILQIFLLNIYSNLYSTLGSLSILTGIFLIVASHQIEQSISKKNIDSTDKPQCWTKIFSFKF